MAGIAIMRLKAERRNWRKDHPHGFYARPKKNPDGSLDMLVWVCGIPGKAGTDWEGGVYPLTMTFSEEYPSLPPKCQFPAGFFHPNIFPSGTVCLSILNVEKNWKPGITLKQILLGVQDLLSTPNPSDPAQTDAYMQFVQDRAKYDERVKRQARTFF
eukprot:CAMPEP_0177681742 /NCGR_PEP_ID=MMETSP0447-20121125/30887_1 /TAXON_ID=0 /ORGANISM="Stygamoeba regulata, Strain BSH-02190019" /LENGTH=156 /DNA_ID=CAMNT_0019191197 /DNA_START=226 /DNA_END=693 /DNA_ORIENTATION=-